MPTKPDAEFRIALRESGILTSPRFNKGSAFTREERAAFGLTGRLPQRVNTLEEQCERAYEQYQDAGAKDLARSRLMQNKFLDSLKQQNWVLYYGLIKEHLGEMIPVIYTPTEADAIAQYSHLFRKSDGLFLCIDRADSMEKEYLAQTSGREISLVVCSDGGAILGIGDQGAGAIRISEAKAALYTLIAGFDPSRTLFVDLDVGTDNEKLLKDPLYMGWAEKRVEGERYDEFVDKFVQLVRKHHPHCLLHFEDFGVANAHRILDRYREHHAVFNDDIQGTGAVTLACIMAAVGVTKTKLSEQRYVIFGAGSAGLGIVAQLRDAITTIDSDVSKEDANSKFYLVDRYGLLKESLGSDKLREGTEDFVQADKEWEDVSTNEDGGIDLLEVVKKVKPTVLVGCSTQAGAFTEEVVKAMYAECERPIILPLSNPSKLVEVSPEDANKWTEGNALIATGSPFPPVKKPNGEEYIVAECNNALIYPGLGFGAMVAMSRTVTDTMIIAGARKLASLAPALEDPHGALLPPFENAFKINTEVAIAVAQQAIEEGKARVDWSKEDAEDKVESCQWQPFYGTYVYDEAGDT
ncbi:hypothetical protein BDV98DRAFT_540974 [Pterulicium gracile]|uniref:Malic enzyme n=1 Tax=Pterulicium gracile TaxID=1884261 RepID=A0A5C3R1X1_9AGAR|nr:hypothetical protein BDV98DRAFT_540974 [Pterula gracilis]